MTVQPELTAAEQAEWRDDLKRKDVWLRKTHVQSVLQMRERYSADRCGCSDCSKRGVK